MFIASLLFGDTFYYDYVENILWALELELFYYSYFSKVSSFHAITDFLDGFGEELFKI